MTCLEASPSILNITTYPKKLNFIFFVIFNLEENNMQWQI